MASKKKWKMVVWMAHKLSSTADRYCSWSVRSNVRIWYQNRRLILMVAVHGKRKLNLILFVCVTRLWPRARTKQKWLKLSFQENLSRGEHEGAIQRASLNRPPGDECTSSRDIFVLWFASNSFWWLTLISQ